MDLAAPLPVSGYRDPEPLRRSACRYWEPQSLKILPLGKEFLLKPEPSNKFTAGFGYPDHLLEFDSHDPSRVSATRWCPGWDLNPHDLAAKGF